MESELLAKISACKVVQAYCDKMESELDHIAYCYEAVPTLFKRLRSMVADDLTAFRVQLAEVRGE